MTTVKEIVGEMGGATAEDIAVVEKAYEFSKKAHESQKRYSGEPYSSTHRRRLRRSQSMAWTQRRSPPDSSTMRSRTRASRARTLKKNSARNCSSSLTA